MMNPIRWLIQWVERRRTRKALLATPGVDLLVRRVMDERYGVHHWRVRAGVLEAEVQAGGLGDSWWGPIGPLRHASTRAWLRKGAPLSHAKHVDYEPPYVDTIPEESTK